MMSHSSEKREKITTWHVSTYTHICMHIYIYIASTTTVFSTHMHAYIIYSLLSRYVKKTSCLGACYKNKTKTNDKETKTTKIQKENKSKVKNNDKGWGQRKTTTKTRANFYNTTRKDKTTPGKLCPDTTRQSNTTIIEDKTRQYNTIQENTRQDKTRQNETRQGKKNKTKQVGQDNTRQDQAGQDQPRKDKTRQVTTRHDTTRLDKIRHDKK